MNLKEGVFDFSDRLDLKAFIELSQSLGFVCDRAPVTIYLCGMGIWRSTSLALDERKYQDTC